MNYYPLFITRTLVQALKHIHDFYRHPWDSLIHGIYFGHWSDELSYYVSGHKILDAVLFLPLIIFCIDVGTLCIDYFHAKIICVTLYFHLFLIPISISLNFGCIVVTIKDAATLKGLRRFWIVWLGVIFKIYDI